MVHAITKMHLHLNSVVSRPIALQTDLLVCTLLGSEQQPRPFHFSGVLLVCTLFGIETETEIILAGLKGSLLSAL